MSPGRIIDHHQLVWPHIYVWEKLNLNRIKPANLKANLQEIKETEEHVKWYHVHTISTILTTENYTTNDMGSSTKTTRKKKDRNRAGAGGGEREKKKRKEGGSIDLET